jgi:hypothetical protein
VGDLGLIHRFLEGETDFEIPPLDEEYENESMHWVFE